MDESSFELGVYAFVHVEPDGSGFHAREVGWCHPFIWPRVADSM